MKTLQRLYTKFSVVVILLATFCGAYQMHQWQTTLKDPQSTTLDVITGYFMGALMGFGMSGACLAFIAGAFLGLRFLFTDRAPNQ